MRNLYLKPGQDAAGNVMLVRDPIDWKPLDPAGEWKSESPYWICRLRDRDAIDATAEKLAEADASARPARKAKPETSGD